VDPKFSPQYVVNVLSEIGGDKTELGQYAVDDGGKAMSRSLVCQVLALRTFPEKSGTRMRSALHKMLESKEAELRNQLRRCRLRLGQVRRM
jgi:hypothetical protein